MLRNKLKKVANNLINVFSFADDSSVSHSHSKSNSSKTSLKLIGTANYFSPEIINLKKTNGEEDFWSLGIVIYYIFTKKLPFNAENVCDIFDNIVNNNIDWDILEATDISPALLELLKGLLNHDFDDRIKDLNTIKSSSYFKGKSLFYMFI